MAQKVICAWCGRTLGYHPGVHGVSDGICSFCRDKELGSYHSMMGWYQRTVSAIRDNVDIRKISYDQGMCALAELARILDEDAGVRTLWAE